MKCGEDKSTPQLGPGQSLLKFMDMASDTVKCAMSKPTNFKKNINHRRYLQRQVKSFVKSGRRKTNCPKKTPTSNLRDDVQHLVREAIKELRFSYAGAVQGSPSAATTAVLPAPIQSHLGITCSARLNTTYRLTHLPEKLSPASPRQDLLPRNAVPKFERESDQPLPCLALACSRAAEDDLFMSGEELTNNIDINDLYIPELHEPKSPIVNCDDYFVESDLEIPSPLYDSPETECSNFQFEFDSRHHNRRVPKFKEFLWIGREPHIEQPLLWRS